VYTFSGKQHPLALLPEVDPCGGGNHGCEHDHFSTEDSCVCRCRRGYLLRPDGKTCKSEYTSNNKGFRKLLCLSAQTTDRKTLKSQEHTQKHLKWLCTHTSTLITHTHAAAIYIVYISAIFTVKNVYIFLHYYYRIVSLFIVNLLWLRSQGKQASHVFWMYVHFKNCDNKIIWIWIFSFL